MQDDVDEYEDEDDFYEEDEYEDEYEDDESDKPLPTIEQCLLLARVTKTKLTYKDARWTVGGKHRLRFTDVLLLRSYLLRKVNFYDIHELSNLLRQFERSISRCSGRGY